MDASNTALRCSQCLFESGICPSTSEFGRFSANLKHEMQNARVTLLLHISLPVIQLHDGSKSKRNCPE